MALVLSHSNNNPSCISSELIRLCDLRKLESKNDCFLLLKHGSKEFGLKDNESLAVQIFKCLRENNNEISKISCPKILVVTNSDETSHKDKILKKISPLNLQNVVTLKVASPSELELDLVRGDLNLYDCDCVIFDDLTVHGRNKAKDFENQTVCRILKYFYHRLSVGFQDSHNAAHGFLPVIVARVSRSENIGASEYYKTLRFWKEFISPKSSASLDKFFETDVDCFAVKNSSVFLPLYYVRTFFDELGLVEFWKKIEVETWANVVVNICARNAENDSSQKADYPSFPNCAFVGTLKLNFSEIRVMFGCGDNHSFGVDRDEICFVRTGRSRDQAKQRAGVCLVEFLHGHGLLSDTLRRKNCDDDTKKIVSATSKESNVNIIKGNGLKNTNNLELKMTKELEALNEEVQSVIQDDDVLSVIHTNNDSDSRNFFLLPESIFESQVLSRRDERRFQRLEWIGDSVLSILVSEFLYKASKNGGIPLSEGDMTELKGLLVSNSALSARWRRLEENNFEPEDNSTSCIADDFLQREIGIILNSKENKYDKSDADRYEAAIGLMRVTESLPQVWETVKSHFELSRSAVINACLRLVEIRKVQNKSNRGGTRTTGIDGAGNKISTSIIEQKVSTDFKAVEHRDIRADEAIAFVENTENYVCEKCGVVSTSHKRVTSQEIHTN